MADPLSPPPSSARHSLYLHPLPFLSSPSQISPTLCLPSHLCSLFKTTLKLLFLNFPKLTPLSLTKKVCNFRDKRFWSLEIAKWGQFISSRSHLELKKSNDITSNFVDITTSKAVKFILTPSLQKDVHSFLSSLYMCLVKRLFTIGCLGCAEKCTQCA